jgi:hypothetical protein
MGVTWKWRFSHRSMQRSLGGGGVGLLRPVQLVLGSLFQFFSVNTFSDDSSGEHSLVFFVLWWVGGSSSFLENIVQNSVGWCGLAACVFASSGRHGIQLPLYERRSRKVAIATETTKAFIPVC